MSQKANKLDYLKKYLGDTSKDAKKKKRLKIKGKGMKIIDDDVDMSKMRQLGDDELEMLGDGEDAPVVVGIIDERPEHVRIADTYSKDKWKVITEDDGFNSSITVKNIVNKSKESKEDLSPVRNKRSQNVGSPSNDSREYDRHQSPEVKNSKHRVDKRDAAEDLSPVRNKDLKNSKHRVDKRDAAEDLSPVRKKDSKNSKHRVDKRDAAEDLSPVRNKDLKNSKHRVDKRDAAEDLSPVRNKDLKNSKHRVDKRNAAEDLSPVRNKKSQKDYDPNRSKKNRWENDDSHSREIRKGKHRHDGRDSTEDLSPVRNKKSQKDYDPTRIKKSRWENEDDDSSRSNTRDERKDGKDRAKDLSPVRNKRSQNSDFSNHKNNSASRSKKSRWESESVEESHRNNTESREHRKPKDDSDSATDLSPVRKRPQTSEPTTSTTVNDRNKTGFQDAKLIRDEIKEYRNKEDDMFNKMSDEVSGRNAMAIKRNIRNRETSADREKQREKEEKQKELDAKYSTWGKGIKQIEEREARIKDFVHEASKPLARYENDRDLEQSLKNRERDGDPMLEYMRRKDQDKGTTSNQPVYPVYKGPFPPNRFNIRPGHRWDGVDRSNGHEKSYFAANSKRAALEAEKYKWSTEDM